MPREVRLNLKKKKKSLIYVSKGVIWASEYRLGPQIWGPGGGAGGPGPPWIRYCIMQQFLVN